MCTATSTSLIAAPDDLRPSELGTDLWALGAWWGAVVAPSWERTVASSLDGIRAEAERRAHPGREI